MFSPSFKPSPKDDPRAAASLGAVAESSDPCTDLDLHSGSAPEPMDQAVPARTLDLLQDYGYKFKTIKTHGPLLIAKGHDGHEPTTIVIPLDREAFQQKAKELTDRIPAMKRVCNEIANPIVSGHLRGAREFFESRDRAFVDAIAQFCDPQPIVQYHLFESDVQLAEAAIKRLEAAGPIHSTTNYGPYVLGQLKMEAWTTKNDPIVLYTAMDSAQIKTDGRHLAERLADVRPYYDALKIPGGVVTVDTSTNHDGMTFLKILADYCTSK